MRLGLVPMWSASAVLLTLVLPTEARAACGATFIDDRHVMISLDRPDALRICTLQREGRPALRCTAFPASGKASRLLRVPKDTSHIYISTAPAMSGPPAGLMQSCSAVRQTPLEWFLQPEVIAAIITMVGTNLILLIAFSWRRWLDERRAYSDWIAAYRSHLSAESGSQPNDFAPAEDDRFVRAGGKAKRLRKSLIATIEGFYRERNASRQNALVADDARALREKLLKMV